MRRHRFRLQKVLEARERNEDEKKRDLARARRIFLREEKRLSDDLLRWEECRLEALRRREGKLDVVEESRWRDYFDHLAREIARQRETVKHCSRNVESAREALVRASTDRKVLEKLKETGMREFAREIDRMEQKENDDAGRDLFIRKARNVNTGENRRSGTPGGA